MAIVAELSVALFVATDPVPQLKVDILHDVLQILGIDIDVLAGAVDQLAPGTSTEVVPVQRIGARCLIDGIAGSEVALHGEELLAWRVDRTETSAGFSIAVPSQQVDVDGSTVPSRVPDPFVFGVPPPGLQDVAFEIFHQTGDFVDFDVGLLREALSRSSGRSVSVGVDTITINGQGPEARYREAPISIELSPGHGLTPQEIGSQIATLAGVAPAQIALGEVGSARANEYVVNCAPAWQDLLNLYATFGRAVRFDDANPPLLRDFPLDDSGETVKWTITGRDVYGDGVELRIDVAEGPPTCVLVTGTRLEEPTDGVLGSTVSETTVVETFEDNFVVPTARFVQQAGATGTLVALGPEPPPKNNVLTARTTTTEVLNSDGCLLLRTVVEEAYFSPEAAKFFEDLAGGITFQGGVNVYEAGATAGDNSATFLWPDHRFVEVSSTEERLFRNSGGFTTLTEFRGGGWRGRQQAVEQVDDNGDVVAIVPGFRFADGTGLELAKGQLYHNGNADPDAASPQVPLTPLNLTGRLAGRWQTATDTTPTIDELNYKPVEQTETRTFKTEGSGAFRFADGTLNSVTLEPGRVVEDLFSSFSAGAGGGHVQVDSGTDDRGRALPTVVTTGAGHIPSADHCSHDEAMTKNTREIGAEVCRGDEDRVPKTLKVSNRWIESVDEADALAQRLVVDGQKPRLTYTGPPSASMRPGDVFVLDLPEAGPAYHGARGIVNSVQFSGEHREILMTVNAKMAGAATEL